MRMRDPSNRLILHHLASGRPIGYDSRSKLQATAKPQDAIHMPSMFDGNFPKLILEDEPETAINYFATSLGVNTPLKLLEIGAGTAPHAQLVASR